MRVDATAQDYSFADMTLADVMASVLGDKAMNATELTVAIMEAGYVTAMTRRSLRHAICELFRERPERFTKEDDDRWRLTIPT